MAFNGLLAPALKRVRLQFVQYLFYRLVSLEQEKQSRMACIHGQIRTFAISACAHKVRVNPNIRLRGETSMCLSASKEGPDTST
jgi:hypothetical protein